MNFNKAEFYRSYGTFSQLPACDRAEFAFAGRSNVGKSSCINKIFNRKSLARVSSVPGKTATINFYSVDNCYMVDLPGYGYAKIAKSDKERWSGLIEGYLMSDRDIAIIFQLIDIRHKPSADDIHMINFMIDNELPFVIIFTKADKLTKNQRIERIQNFENEVPCFKQIKSVVFSAVTGEGVKEIHDILNDIQDENDLEG